MVDSEEEEEEEQEEGEEVEDSDKSDGELNADAEQNIGYDTVCAICDNGGEILPYVFIIQVYDHEDLLCFTMLH